MITWQKETLKKWVSIYNFLGLTCGFINNDQNDFERKKIIIVTSPMQLIASSVLTILKII